MLPIGIREREQLSELDSLAEDYSREYGSLPFNLSHWDPSDQTIKAMLKELSLPEPPLALPYLYSDELDAERAVIERLGLATPERGCLIVPTGTNAVLFGALWLKALNVSETLILCPSYFPVFYDFRLMGMPFSRVFHCREQRRWRLPKEEILTALARSPSRTAVWITNPIYCTGVHLCAEDAPFLDSLLARGIPVVLDECLCLGGQELGRLIAASDRLLGLYSPHKSLCVNAIKFAAVLYDNAYQRLFTHWSDVLVGGLSASNHAAIVHFLGDNFIPYQTAFMSYIELQRINVATIIRQRQEWAELDEEAKGYFLTCYTPAIRAAQGDMDFLRKLVFTTGAQLIPGSRNHFSPACGFNFRINLARGCHQFYAALHRTIDYLASVC